MEGYTNTPANRLLLQTAEREAYNVLNDFGKPYALEEDVLRLRWKYFEAWQHGQIVILDEYDEFHCKKCNERITTSFDKLCPSCWSKIFPSGVSWAIIFDISWWDGADDWDVVNMNEIKTAIFIREES